MTSTTDTAPTDDPTPRGPRPRKAPPRNPTKPASSPAAKTVGRPTVDDKRARVVADQYRIMGGVVSLAGILDRRLAAAGAAMVDHADDLGRAWSAWAATSSRVAKIIDSATTYGGAIAVAVAHAPIVGAILAPPTGGGLSLADFLGGLNGLDLSALGDDPAATA